MSLIEPGLVMICRHSATIPESDVRKCMAPCAFTGTNIETDLPFLGFRLLSMIQLHTSNATSRMRTNIGAASRRTQMTLPNHPDLRCSESRRQVPRPPTNGQGVFMPCCFVSHHAEPRHLALTSSAHTPKRLGCSFLRAASSLMRTSSRQLCRHVLPVADMEATPHIGLLFAPRAVWNINLHDCPGAHAFLCNPMGRDECHFPLNARPTLGAVRLFIPIAKACGHQEQGFVGDKTVNADVMRCLHYALTFQRSDSGHETYEA